MIHSSALCVYMNMCSVLWTTTTECIQLVATQALDVLTAYHKSSCILSCRAFLAAYACTVLTPWELWAHICGGLNLFFFFLCYLLCVWRQKAESRSFVSLLWDYAKKQLYFTDFWGFARKDRRMCRTVEEVCHEKWWDMKQGIFGCGLMLFTAWHPWRELVAFLYCFNEAHGYASNICCWPVCKSMSLILKKSCKHVYWT